MKGLFVLHSALFNNSTCLYHAYTDCPNNKCLLNRNASACVRCTDRCLEAAVQLCEVRVTACQRQHPLFSHGTLHIIILQDDVLLQHLDSENSISVVKFCQHHLQIQNTQSTTDENSQVFPNSRHFIIHFLLSSLVIPTLPKLPLPRTWRNVKSERPRWGIRCCLLSVLCLVSEGALIWLAFLACSCKKRKNKFKKTHHLD